MSRKLTRCERAAGRQKGLIPSGHPTAADQALSAAHEAAELRRRAEAAERNRALAAEALQSPRARLRSERAARALLGMALFLGSGMPNR